jgi:hypothetical protein
MNAEIFSSLFCGFLQNSVNFDVMPPVKQGFEHFSMNYIITDDSGYISNITEGFLHEVGLHAKFF